MEREVRGCIRPDHPALTGHFPGNPIVPGVVLLTELTAATEQLLHWMPGPLELTSVKFMRLLRPNEPFTILLTERVQGEVSFTVLRDQLRIAAGTLRRSEPRVRQDRS